MVNHPEMCEDDVLRPNDTVCVRIPIKAPEGSIFRTETAIDTLERVKKFATEWILPGHLKGDNTHNVSATISIDPSRRYYRVKDEEGNFLTNALDTHNIGEKLTIDEWQTVGEWMWENREHYNGLSVLPYDNGSYVQPPFEDITEEEYNKRIATLHSLDLTKVMEIDDNVEFGQTNACSGGSCAIE
jgi:ribonucleoside-diphosphate reductase alpha chain